MDFSKGWDCPSPFQAVTGSMWRWESCGAGAGTGHSAGHWASPLGPPAFPRGLPPPYPRILRGGWTSGQARLSPQQLWEHLLGRVSQGLRLAAESGPMQDPIQKRLFVFCQTEDPPAPPLEPSSSRVACLRIPLRTLASPQRRQQGAHAEQAAHTALQGPSPLSQGSRDGPGLCAAEGHGPGPLGEG